MNKISQSINKSQEEFEEKYRSFQLCEMVNINDRNRLKDFLRQSNTELLGAVVESLPKERNVHIDPQDKGKSIIFEIEGYNQALSEIKQIIQEAIKANGKEEKN